jgi:hypothetical protein
VEHGNFWQWRMALPNKNKTMHHADGGGEKKKAGKK